MVDRLEKIARLVLWLSMAAAFLVAPVAYTRTQQEARAMAERAAEREKAAALRERREKTEALEQERIRLAEQKNERRGRLTLASMGSYFSAPPQPPSSSAKAVFSNASNRGGFVCLIGELKNPTTGQSTRSLAGCQEVAPYSSTVQLSVFFAPVDYAKTCPQPGSCTLQLSEAP